MGFGIRYSVWVLVMLLIIFNTFENSLNFSESNFLIFVLEQQSLCHRIIKGSKGHNVCKMWFIFWHRASTQIIVIFKQEQEKNSKGIKKMRKNSERRKDLEISFISIKIFIPRNKISYFYKNITKMENICRLLIYYFS